MKNVQRYGIIPDMVYGHDKFGPVTSHTEPGYFVAEHEFDRVTVELESANSDKEAYAQNAIDLRKRVDALQQRLTAADERADVLEGLLRRAAAFTRDLHNPISLRRDIYAALKPAEAPRNQCDGCQAGIPVVSGAHRMGKTGGYPDTMSCTAKLYKPAEGGGDEIY